MQVSKQILGNILETSLNKSRGAKLNSLKTMGPVK